MVKSWAECGKAVISKPWFLDRSLRALVKIHSLSSRSEGSKQHLQIIDATLPLMQDWNCNVSDDYFILKLWKRGSLTRSALQNNIRNTLLCDQINFRDGAQPLKVTLFPNPQGCHSKRGALYWRCDLIEVGEGQIINALHQACPDFGGRPDFQKAWNQSHLLDQASSSVVKNHACGQHNPHSFPLMFARGHQGRGRLPMYLLCNQGVKECNKRSPHTSSGKCVYLNMYCT